MRKVSIFGSLLAVSMLAVGATAAQAVAPTGTFTGSISPTKTGKPLKKLVISGTTDTIPGMLMPPIPKLITMTLPKTTVDKRALRGTDTMSSVKKKGRCSKSRYRLGTMRATAHAVPLIPTVETGGEVCIVKTNSGSVMSLALAARYDPLGIIIGLPVEVKIVGGNLVIETDTSVLFELVGGQSTAISKFAVTTNRNPHRKVGKGKKRKTVYLMMTPAKCKNNMWAASSTTTFFDADPLTLTGTSKCTQTKKKRKKKSKKK